MKDDVPDVGAGRHLPRWSLRAPYVLCVVLVVANLWILSPELVGPATFPVIELAGLLTTVTAARGSVDRRGARAWWLLAGGFVLLALTGVALVASGFGEHPDSLQDVSTGGFLAGLLLRFGFALVLLSALLMLNTRPVTGSARWRLGLDVLTVVGGGLMALWYLVLGPVLTRRQLDNPLFGISFGVLTLADLVLVLGVSSVLLSGVSPPDRRPVLLLLAASVTFLVADVYFVLGLTDPDVFTRRAANLFQLVPQLFLVLAATEQRRRNLRRRRGQPVSSRSLRPVTWLPYGALLLSSGLMAVAAVRTGLFPWGGLIVGSIVMTAAVSSR
ncbi:hypothetical protein [Kineosporia succinea]|uniref:Uncharacterized protein n=1 Tax=Kineosporia succinea TaxID=84632 RepID=A0ABT9PET8_9ACTN|nr:hypothetical protein [Kineosporia succinea]MDP9831198.1 hypothetical protein [Kineosporia succinea]